MNMREQWFEGMGLKVTHLKDFCTEEGYAKLSEDIHRNTIKFPTPLDVFFDNQEGGAIVIWNYNVSPVIEAEDSLKELVFYTKQSLAEMIVERLAADYLKNPDCKLTNDEEPLSPEVFKATVVKAISQCFESLQLCYWE